MQDDLTAVSCHACGVYDASLRHSEHPSVISTLVAANVSARVGIWCARCRGIESAKAAAITLLAGWWSLRGPKLTIDALRTNLSGGKQHASTNAQMLRGIARLQFDAGNPELASMFARAAHSTQPQRENSRLIDELNRGGFRQELAKSPWRFAPAASVAMIAVVILTIGWKALPDGEDAPASVAPMVQASVVTPPAPTAAEDRRMVFAKEQAYRGQSAEELQRQLKQTYERALAHAYVQARLRQVKGEIPTRVRRGEDLRAIFYSISEFRTHPGISPLIHEPGQKARFDYLFDSINDATRYYRGGPSIEAMERTAGESFNVTVDVAVDAIIADMQGNTERTDRLATEVVARAESIEAMRQDVRVRAAVIALTQKAIDRCLDSGF